jgi:hypothetical protein
VATIQFSDVEDEMLWQFNSSGIYSSQSLYKIINFRGVKSVHVSAGSSPSTFLSMASD